MIFSLKSLAIRIAGLLAFLCVSLDSFADYPSGSPVAINGKLKVVGTQMVNECGYPVQLRGMSTHGPQWFGNCICNEALQTLVDDWHISLFRIAMYVQENGYVDNKEYWRGFIDDLVDQCGSLGIYCLIDWHVLNPGNPNANIDDSKEFWQYMSNKHGQKKHVLYEICNEPNGTDWSTVKSYAEQIVPIIRNNNDETIIIIGTPTWSQDVDVASNDKVSGSNLMYTLHFYAGSHGQELRSKAETAISNGCAIFVTEFGTSSASGDGGYSPDATRTWISWMNEKNISWANWSFSDKGEVSAALASGACSGKNWNNTTESGALIKSLISENAFAYTNCDGANSDSGNDSNSDSGNSDNNNNNSDNSGDSGNSGNDSNDSGNSNDDSQNNDQNVTEPVVYPEIVSNINSGNVYRLVNKASGKFMSVNSADQVEQTSSADDNKQQFRIVSAGDGYYFLVNRDSKLVLTNKYNPNDGAVVYQEEESQYDNPSQKWKITLVDGSWFRIENKAVSGGSSCIEVHENLNADGSAVLQYTWSNSDNQLWGFEYMDAASGLQDAVSDALTLVPSVTDDVFLLTGSLDYNRVSVLSASGVVLKNYMKQQLYDVSDLASGIYVVVVYSADESVRIFRLIRR